MAIPTSEPEGNLPRYVPVGGSVLAAVLVFRLAYGAYWMPGLSRAAFELVTVAILAIAAGGWGHLLVRALAPKELDAGLRMTTSAIVGLWGLSLFVLAAGTIGGVPSGAVCWAVLGGGGVLAGIQGRRALAKLSLGPGRVDQRALLWIVLGICVGFWLAGALRPPGTTGMADADAVLTYHLQVPREFYDDGRVHPLRHNAYSFFPLGTEMLFLLAMCLRGGPYEGMYLAKMVPGLFGVLAVGGVFLGLRREASVNGRTVAGLLASTPAALYLGWLAWSDLGAIAALAFAVLFLREWWRRPTWRSAAMVGLLAGVGCSVGYSAFALVLAPLAGVVLAKALVHPARLRHWAALVLAAFAAVSPWLIRNVADTGNPVFPMATSAFGRGHWSPELAERWRGSHGPATHSPVPEPPGWEAPRQIGKARRLVSNFLGSQWFGQVTLVLAAGLAVLLALRRTSLPRWDWLAALLGILLVQMGLWTVGTARMPWRTIAPGVVPVAFLGGEALARIAALRKNPLDRRPDAPRREGWGLLPAVAIFAFALLVNFVAVFHGYRLATQGRGQLGPAPARWIRQSMLPYAVTTGLPAGARTLLLGDAKAFYYPSNTVYATGFDANPLTDGGIGAVRRKGITHVLVTWPGLWRQAAAEGCPAELSHELYRRWRAGKPPGLTRLEQLGLRRVAIHPAPSDPLAEQKRDMLTFDKPSGPPDQRRWDPAAVPENWPWVTLYAVPPAGAEETWRPKPVQLPAPPGAEQPGQAEGREHPRDDTSDGAGNGNRGTALIQ